MYDHVRDLPSSSKIDLFIYTRGGAIEVPWRMITMLREHCNHLAILIPYRAHSAGTLLALGCDEIVMCKKAELSPIDPALGISQERGTEAKEQIQVEDVMSFIRFIKEVAGLTDQSAIADNVRILTEKLSPWVLGSIHRTHTHIRMVAQRLLNCHRKKLPDQDINRITETLAEKIYSHGHAICRREAKQIGLPVNEPSAELDTVLWGLLQSYEDLLELNDPLDPYTRFPLEGDEVDVEIIIAVIESELITSAFNGTLKLKRVRQAPQQININLNLTLALPPQTDPRSIPAELQQSINRALQEIQRQAPEWVRQQTKSQCPIAGIEARFANAAWRDITSEQISLPRSDI
jgi:hypothetical protein